MTNGLPALNVPLLSNIVAWAHADATHDQTALEDFGWGHWDQGVWAAASLDAPEDNESPTSHSICGSSFCIAGQAAAQVGYRMVMEENYGRFTATHAQPHIFAGLDKGRPVYEPVGQPRLVADVARDALGLTEAEQSALFASHNSIGNIVGLALLFAEARGEELLLSDEVREVGLDWLNSRRNDVGDWEDAYEAFENYVFYAYGTDDDSVYRDVAVERGWWSDRRAPEVCYACGQELPE